MNATAASVSPKQFVPLLGMMWRGMWGATAATAAAQVIAADEADEDDQPV